MIDFGLLPLATHAVDTNPGTPEPTYRVRVRICDECALVQNVNFLASQPDVDAGVPLPPHAPASEEATRRLAASLTQKWRLAPGSRVVQIGSRDNALLRHFQAAGMPVLRIDAPPACTAEPAIPTEFTALTAETAVEITVRAGRSDFVIVDDALTTAPDLFDFGAGLASLVRPSGVIMVTVPHVLPLLQQVQFDAFRHDVCAYLSLQVLERVFCSVGLRVFDAERLAEHGGFLRVYACPMTARYTARPGLKAVRMAEAIADAAGRDLYSGFSARVASARDQIRAFVAIRHAAGRRIAAYGASCRSTMLLNVCGLTANEITCVADRDSIAFDRYLPGSHVRIVPLQRLADAPPDDLLLLPWSQVHDISAGLQGLREAGTQFWTLLPRIGRV